MTDDPSLAPRAGDGAPMSRRDALRPRLLECLRAADGSVTVWDEDAHLRRDGTDLWLFAQVIEDEFEIVITVPNIIDLALAGPTMGRWLDLVEAALDANRGGPANTNHGGPADA